MEFFKPFLAVLVIFQESIKLLSKNRKLVALTLVPSLLLSSLIFIVFNISSKSFMFTVSKSFVSMSSTGEFTPEFFSALSRFMQDSGLLFLIYLAFFLASSIISILSTTAYILLSAVSKTERNLPFKDFALLVVKKCIRPVITAFYTYRAVGYGYFFIVLAISVPIFMFSEFGLGRVPLSIILFGISSYFSFMILSMTWILSFVVSVVEENCYGVEALGKAVGLIEGKRLQGFILSSIFAAFSLVVYQGMRIFAEHGWLENYIVLWLFVLSLSALGKLFLFVTYTVLYFHCKKHHGEEIELQVEMYQKINNAPILVGDDMA